MKRAITSVVAVLFHGHFAIPLIAAGLSYSSLLALDRGLEDAVAVLLVIAAAAGAFAVYQFDSAFGGGREDEVNRANRRRWREGKEPFLLALASAAAVTALLICVFVFPRLQLIALVLAAVGTCYVLPVLPGVGRIRSIWFLKPVVVAGAWSAGTVLVPLVGLAADIAPGALLGLVVYRFLFLLPNAVASDLGDAPGDQLAGHDTVAARYRSSTLLRLCTALAVPPALGLVLMAPVMPIAWILLESVGLALSAVAIRVLPQGIEYYPAFIAADGPEQYRFRIDGVLLWYLPATLLVA